MNEYVADGDWDAVQRNFEKLRAFVPDTGGKSVGLRFGVATVTWPGGSQQSDSINVTHGLGKTPTVVFTQSDTVIAHARPASIGATQFAVQMRTVDGSSPLATRTDFVYWIAIG